MGKGEPGTGISVPAVASMANASRAFTFWKSLTYRKRACGSNPAPGGPTAATEPDEGVNAPVLGSRRRRRREGYGVPQAVSTGNPLEFWHGYSDGSYLADTLDAF
jgi:hypothetical protein